MRRSISSLKKIEIPWRRLTSAFRRNVHGGAPWAATSALSQPQDGGGTSDTHARITEIDAHLHAGNSVPLGILNEPEDAQITGGTRSLTRRLIGLNIIQRRAKPVAAASDSRAA